MIAATIRSLLAGEKCVRFLRAQRVSDKLRQLAGQAFREAGVEFIPLLATQEVGYLETSRHFFWLLSGNCACCLFFRLGPFD